MNKTTLKYNVMATGSHFFDKSTMRFFGDTMANYYVPKSLVHIKTISGVDHTCYELQRVCPVKHNLCDSAYFDVDSFEKVTMPIFNN